MANYTINKIVLPNGDVCSLQDTTYSNATASAAGLMSAADKTKLDGILTEPIETRTYTNVIATSNDNRGGGFFCLKVRPLVYTDIWRVKMRVTATVPSNINYRTETVSEVCGTENLLISYKNQNAIKSTSYRPIYYTSVFNTNATGYANECGHWMGFSLRLSTNPTDASLKRTVIVDLLGYENCEVEFSNTLITPDNIPNRAAHTNWYSSNNSSYSNYDAFSQGTKMTGDANTTTISNLTYGDYYKVTKNALYRYQMLFTVDDNRVTPLNTNDNVIGTTKTMLTDEEFDPLGQIYYWWTTTTKTANADIGGGSLMYAVSTVDLRYTFNIANDGSRTAYKPLYMKVTPQSNGKCKLSSADPLTQTLPSTEDGYLYIELGRVYDWYRIAMPATKPVWWYKNGKVIRYTGDLITSQLSVATVAETRAYLGIT